MDLARAMRRRSQLVDRVATRGETEVLLVRNDPVLVLSMGKTGTSSIESSIGEVTGRPVLKAHALTRTGIERRHQRERRLGHGVRPRFLWRTEQIRIDLLLRRARRWDVVSAVREPVARAASAYFYGERLRAFRTGGEPADAPMEQHVAGVLEILEHITSLEDWYRDEFQPITGIDVYATPFPHETGAAEYRDGRFRALVLRSEDLADVAQPALGRFFDRPWPRLEHRNQGPRDDEDSAYSQFLAAPHLPAEAVDRAYASTLARHFYRDEELARFRSQWVS